MPIEDGQAQVVQLSELINLIQQRKMVLPIFQRQIKWEWQKRKSLLESISLDMPIGMFMLWKIRTTPDAGKFRPIEGFDFPHPRRETQAYDTARAGIEEMLLDGQQRLTFLAALHHIDPATSEDWKWVNCTIQTDRICFSEANEPAEIDHVGLNFCLNKLLSEGNGVDPRFAEFTAEQRTLISRLYSGLTSKRVLVQSLYSRLSKGYALYSYDKLNTAGTRLSQEDMAEAKLINVYPSLYQNISQAEAELATPLYPGRSWSRLFNRSMLIKSLLEELYRTCKPSAVEIRGLTIFDPTYRRDRDYTNPEGRLHHLSRNAVSTSWCEVAASMG